MEERIQSLLKKLGIEQDQKGYSYLFQAIYRTVEDFELVGSVTKLLYSDLAREYHSTSVHVERTIRYLVEKSWEQGDEATFERLFGYNRTNGQARPTNSEYIAILADEARR